MTRFVLRLIVGWLLLPAAFAVTSFDVREWDTKEGCHVVFYQAMDVPILDISMAFAAGSAYDGEAYGLSALTSRLLNQGNGGLNADRVAEKWADLGAQFDVATNQDMVVLHVKTLTKKDILNKASDIFATIVAHPDFPTASFDREKNQQLAAILQAQESADDVANQVFYQMLYKKHPYAHPVLGDNAHVKALSLENVRDFYHRFFVSKNAMIVMVGAIDMQQAKSLAERMVLDLPRGQHAAVVPKAQALREELDVEVAFPSSQTILRMGQLGISHQDSRLFPLMVGNYILGGGALVSRLAIELREKRGFTYNVSSQFSPMPGLGPFIIGFSTKRSQIKAAVDVTRSVLTAFLQTGPSPEELSAAKQYLTGSFPLSLGSNKSIADILLKGAFYHLPNDYLKTYIEHINAVTVEDIKSAFQPLIMPHKLLQVSVGTVAQQSPSR